jgi:hypothetical protein
MEIYEKLRKILDAHPSGAPKSKAFEEILCASSLHRKKRPLPST